MIDSSGWDAGCVLSRTLCVYIFIGCDSWLQRHLLVERLVGEGTRMNVCTLLLVGGSLGVPASGTIESSLKEPNVGHL
jgi:hypothetical protein